MKKITKKQLFASLFGLSFLIATPIIVASCKNDQTPSNKTSNDQNKPTNPEKDSGSTTEDPKDPGSQTGSGTNLNGNVSSEQEKKNFEKYFNGIEVDLKQWSPYNIPKDQITVKKIDLSSIKIELTGIYAKYLNYKIEAIVPQFQGNEEISNRNGDLYLSVAFSLKSNPGIEKSKILKFSGFKPDMTPNLEAPPKPTSEVDKYIQMNQRSRYEYDNNQYLEILKRQIDNKSWDQLRPELRNASSNKITDFNNLANTVGLDNYESAALKGFTLPKYDESGNFLGLSLYDTDEMVKGPSWVDALGRNQYQITGLARTIPNKHYLRATQQTYSIMFLNPDPEHKDNFRRSIPTRGTAWIMDFEKKEDGSYPTKWYFGTNVHVADAFTDETKSVSFTRFNEDIGTRTTLKLTDLESSINHRAKDFIFGNLEDKSIVHSKVKVVFHAKDFLNSKPSDFLVEDQKNKYLNVEEFADFAVIEVDLSQEPDAQNLAKEMTNNYATKVEDHIKFKSKSYLNNYQNIEHAIQRQKNEATNPEKDELYIVGFPLAINDYFFRQYIDDDQIALRDRMTSLWVNSESSYYDKLGNQPETGEPTFSENELNRGNYLSYQIGYRSFIDKPGVTDAFIASNRNGKDFYQSTDNHQYIQYGLNYMPRHYVPYGGASGSSVRNQNNELVAVFHSANSSARVGLAAAFRSEGFDYQGAYGDKYNLPQYDLIYGGGKDQKNSYRQALKQAYTNGIKTNLFPNGVNDDQIPEEFRFNNQPTPNNQNNQ